MLRNCFPFDLLDLLSSVHDFFKIRFCSLKALQFRFSKKIGPLVVDNVLVAVVFKIAFHGFISISEKNDPMKYWEEKYFACLNWLCDKFVLPFICYIWFVFTTNQPTVQIQNAIRSRFQVLSLQPPWLSLVMVWSIIWFYQRFMSHIIVKNVLICFSQMFFS